MLLRDAERYKYQYMVVGNNNNALFEETHATLLCTKSHTEI